MWIDLDFDRAIDHIARGVYFHHFNNKYTGKTDVMSYSLFDVSIPNRQRVNTTLQEWRQSSDTFLATQPRLGNNQAVFYYQTVIDADTQRVGIRLVFYEGFVTDVYFRDPRSINLERCLTTRRQKQNNQTATGIN